MRIMVRHIVVVYVAITSTQMQGQEVARHVIQPTGIQIVEHLHLVMLGLHRVRRLVMEGNM